MRYRLGVLLIEVERNESREIGRWLSVELPTALATRLFNRHVGEISRRAITERGELEHAATNDPAQAGRDADTDVVCWREG